MNLTPFRSFRSGIAIAPLTLSVSSPKRLRRPCGRPGSARLAFPCNARQRKGFVMGLLLLIILILLLMRGLPTWGYSRSWGYGTSGILGRLLAPLLAILML